jgi:hypothetical protein
MTEKSLLTIDAIVNLALGLPLTVVPHSVAEVLGIPVPENPFYPCLLGAILTGIGLALLAERFEGVVGVTGLGLGGAIVINFCGAGVLVVLLIQGGLGLPMRGYIFLWGVALVVLAIGAVEWMAHFRPKPVVHNGDS